MGLSMHSITPAAADIVDSIIRSRKSVRCFKADPVSKDLLMDILETARAAPSNFNSQPWRVHLLTGKAKQALGEAIVRAYQAETHPPFSPFPQPMPADCAARVDDFGRRYYSALGIDRSDMTARARQTGRNFIFFDAPVGLIFTTHATSTKHNWLTAVSSCKASCLPHMFEGHMSSSFVCAISVRNCRATWS
jgi:nitroreductase